MMQPVKVVFLLFPQTHLMDLSGPAQVFYEANALGNRRFELIFAGVDTGISSAQGLPFGPLVAPESLQLQAGDFLCVPGFDFAGFCSGLLDTAISKVRPWLQRQRQQGVYLGSICSGALALAAMGLLDGIPCTTHWKCLTYARERFPHARFMDNRLYVLDKQTFTSAGMTAGTDMALALVERWCTPLLAAKIAQEMVINIRRPETKDQRNTFLDFVNHFNEEVYQAQEILADQFQTDFTVRELAKKMNVSERHLARLFKQHTGQTILDYRNHLRLQHGAQLLQHTEMLVKEIATACGYESSRQFIRLWKRFEQVSPEVFRRRQRSIEA